MSGKKYGMAVEEPGAESGARGHSAAGDVVGVCVDAKSWREGLPVAEDSAGGGGREARQRKRAQVWTAAVSEPVVGASANPVRAEFADRIKGGEKAQGGKRQGRGDPLSPFSRG